MKLSRRPPMGDLCFYDHPLINKKVGGTGASLNLRGWGGHLCGQITRLGGWRSSPDKVPSPSPSKANLSSQPLNIVPGPCWLAGLAPCSSLPGFQFSHHPAPFPPSSPRPSPSSPRAVPVPGGQVLTRGRGLPGNRSRGRGAKPAPPPAPLPGGTLSL